MWSMRYPSGHLSLLRRLRIMLVLGVAGLGLSACSISTISTSDNSVAEFGYSQSVRSGVANINQRDEALHPVCDKGGLRQGCYDATERMIVAIEATQHALAAQAVPGRYAAAHADFIRALATAAQGFRVRNHGTATMNNAEYVKGLGLIHDGIRQLTAAVKKYDDAGLNS